MAWRWIGEGVGFAISWNVVLTREAAADGVAVLVAGTGAFKGLLRIAWRRGAVAGGARVSFDQGVRGHREAGVAAGAIRTFIAARGGQAVIPRTRGAGRTGASVSRVAITSTVFSAGFRPAEST